MISDTSCRCEQDMLKVNCIQNINTKTSRSTQNVSNCICAVNKAIHFTILYMYIIIYIYYTTNSIKTLYKICKDLILAHTPYESFYSFKDCHTF